MLKIEEVKRTRIKISCNECPETREIFYDGWQIIPETIKFSIEIYMGWTEVSENQWICPKCQNAPQQLTFLTA